MQPFPLSNSDQHQTTIELLAYGLVASSEKNRDALPDKEGLATYKRKNNKNINVCVNIC